MKVLCIGNSNYDITIPLNEYPIENKKTIIENQVIECGGGSSSNAACLLSYWGNDTYIASTIGDDIYGEKIKAEYNKYGVNIKYLIKTNLKTSISYVLVNKKNNTRTILIDRDQNLKINELLKLEEKFNYILLDGGNVEFSKEILKNNKDSISILDAGNKKASVLELIYLVDYIVCSNDFAKEYTNIDFKYDDIEEIKKVYDILEKSFKGKIIITLEKYGSFTKINNEYKLIPSIKVDSLDTTGAGDLYHGAFAYFLSKNYDLEKVIKLSNITGALSTKYIGGRNSIPKLNEVLIYDK